MICATCGLEEHQDRKALPRERHAPLMIHHECSAGHAWHMRLVIRPATRATPCDCQDA